MLKKRIYILDLLKFVCAILIFISHLQGETKAVLFCDLRNGHKFSASDLVKLFFIVSGFFSAFKMNNMCKQNFKQYFTNKYMRFLPMTFIATTFYLLVSALYVVINRYFIHDVPMGIWRIINSYLLTYSGGTVLIDEGLNNPLWFVCVLLLCYSSFYFVVWLSEKNNFDVNISLVVSLFICIGIIDYGIELPLFNETMAKGFLNFLTGVFINKIYLKLLENMKVFKHVFMLSISIFICCILLGIYKYDIFFDSPFYIYSFIIFPSLIFMLLYLDTRYDFNYFKVLGGVSFEIYIWHFSFIVLLVCLETIEPSLFIDGYSFLIIIATVVFVIVFSFLMYYFVELPLMNKISKYNKQKR